MKPRVKPEGSKCKGRGTLVTSLVNWKSVISTMLPIVLGPSHVFLSLGTCG